MFGMPTSSGMPSLSLASSATSGADGGSVTLSNLLTEGATVINYGSGSASSVAAPAPVSHTMLVVGVAVAAWFLLKH